MEAVSPEFFDGSTSFSLRLYKNSLYINWVKQFKVLSFCFNKKLSNLSLPSRFFKLNTTSKRADCRRVWFPMRRRCQVQFQRLSRHDLGVTVRCVERAVWTRQQNLIHFTVLFSGVIKWDPFWGNQTMPIYGNFEGFPFS